jgi:hypothetical protein
LGAGLEKKRPIRVLFLGCLFLCDQARIYFFFPILPKKKEKGGRRGREKNKKEENKRTQKNAGDFFF